MSRRAPTDPCPEPDDCNLFLQETSQHCPSIYT
jgi:hypothetical protein